MFALSSKVPSLNAPAPTYCSSSILSREKMPPGSEAPFSTALPVNGTVTVPVVPGRLRTLLAACAVDTGRGMAWTTNRIGVPLMAVGENCT